MGCDEIGHVERMHLIDADEQHMLVGCSCRLAGRKDGEGETHHHAKQNAPAHHAPVSAKFGRSYERLDDTLMKPL
jgi:hypothetical protein